MDYGNVHWLSVVVSTLAAWVLGALWYAPPLFGKIWQKDLGFSDEYLKEGNMAKTFGLSMVMMFVMAFGMQLMMYGHGETSMGWKEGIHHGLYVGVFFVASSVAINYLYQRRSFRLWAVDALYQVIILAIMGAIQGVWH